jgi:hypothetical protein
MERGCVLSGEGFVSGGKKRLALASLVAALALAGCVEGAVEMGARHPTASAPQARIAARSDISPRGASLAFADLEGPPDAIGARFKQQLEKAAATRDVAWAKPENARYRLRGYLTASPALGTTRLAYVLDVYDRGGHRAQRLTFEAGLKAGADPWAVVDDKAIDTFADRGAEDVAAFLSNTPEAIAAAGKDSGVSVVAAQRRSDEKPRQPDGVAQLR